MKYIQQNINIEHKYFCFTLELTLVVILVQLNSST